MKHSKKTVRLYQIAVLGMILFGALCSAELV